MLVKNWMIKPVVTIDVNETMQQAINLMMEHGVSILPVTENGNLAGIVTDRDIKSASPSDVVLLDFQHIVFHLSRLAVGAIMTRKVVTVPLDYTVEETAQILFENRFSGVPVVDEQGHVQGIITKTDLFKVSDSGQRGDKERRAVCGSARRWTGQAQRDHRSRTLI